MKKGKFLAILAAIFLLTASCAPQTTPAAPQPEAALAPGVVPTSRGDQLHATDPATVSLASGGLQLVEFFRFT